VEGVLNLRVVLQEELTEETGRLAMDHLLPDGSARGVVSHALMMDSAPVSRSDSHYYWVLPKSDSSDSMLSFLRTSIAPECPSVHLGPRC
jgi:hypothetical protein